MNQLVERGKDRIGTTDVSKNSSRTVSDSGVGCGGQGEPVQTSPSAARQEGPEDLPAHPEHPQEEL